MDKNGPAIELEGPGRARPGRKTGAEKDYRKRGLFKEAGAWPAPAPALAGQDQGDAAAAAGPPGQVEALTQAPPVGISELARFSRFHPAPAVLVKVTSTLPWL